MQLLEMGQKVIGGDKKRDLDEQSDGTPQNIGGMIVVLPIEGGEHHEPLITFEGLLDSSNPALQPFSVIPFFLLDLFRHMVQREGDHGNNKAQSDNGKSIVIETFHKKVEKHLKEEL